MKTLLSVLAVPFLLAATASADWVLESKIENPQINTETVTKIKGDKLRVNMASGPMGAVSSIIDTASGDSIQLLHGQKMAMKMSAAQMKQAMDAAKKMGGVQEEATPTAPQPTGQMEKIGEYDCEIYTWTGSGVSSRFWIAKNHPQAAALKALEKKVREGVLGAMQKGPDTSNLPGPAIKTEISAGGVKTVNTVLSIKEEPVDAQEFEVPAGYQNMAMPTMPGAK